MKLRSEDTKKLVLAGIGTAAFLYGYFTFLLGPIGVRETASHAAIATLQPQIAAARKQLESTRALELKAPVSSAAYADIKSMIPPGAPVAWFPPRLVEFFKNHGIDKMSVRLDSEAAAIDLPGFRRLNWTVDLPKVEYASLGNALAGIENEDPLLLVRALRIDASPEDVQFPHATLNLTTIATQ